MWTPSDLNDQLQSLATSPTFTSSVPYNPKKHWERGVGGGGRACNNFEMGL